MEEEKLLEQLKDIFYLAKHNSKNDIFREVLSLIFISYIESNKKLVKERISKSVTVKSSSSIPYAVLAGAFLGSLFDDEEKNSKATAIGATVGGILGVLFDSIDNKSIEYNRPKRDFKLLHLKILEYSKDSIIYDGIFDDLNFREEDSKLFDEISHVLDSIDFHKSDKSLITFRNTWLKIVESFCPVFNNDVTYKPINREVSKLFSKIIKTGPNQIVFNPIANNHQVFIDMYEEFNNTGLFYSCETNNRRSLAIGKMTLIISNIYNSEFKITSNLFKEISSRREQDCLNADIALTTSIPYGLIFNSNKDYTYPSSLFKNYPEIKSIEFAYVTYMLDKVKGKTGKVAALLPNGSLLTHKNKIIMEQLFLWDWIEYIIQLPPNVISGTSIRTSIILFNKGKAKERKNKVLLINAERSNFKKLNELSEICHFYQERNDLATTIKLEDFKKNSYSLLPSTYIFEGLSNLNSFLYDKSTYITTVKDIIETFNIGRKIDIKNLSNEGIPLVKISDIPDASHNFEIDIKTISSFISDNNIVKNDRKSVVVSLVGGNLKAGIIQGPVISGQHVVSVILDENKILNEFFIFQLRSKYTSLQIKSLNRGQNVPQIRYSDLEKVKIYVPSISEQRFIIDEYKEMELAKFKSQLKIETTEEQLIASITHQLTHDISKVRNVFKDIQFYIEKKSIDKTVIDINDSIIPEEEGIDTLKETIDKLNSNINASLETLNIAKNSNRMIIEYSTFQIKPFLEKVISRYDKRLPISIEGDNFEFDGDKKRIESIISNLIDNSIKHSECFNIQIFCEIDKLYRDGRDYASISYIDDGKGWPKGYSFENFISFGESGGLSGGSGIGGWDINNIVKKHSGELKEISVEKGIGFEIKIPKARKV